MAAAALRVRTTRRPMGRPRGRDARRRHGTRPPRSAAPGRAGPRTPGGPWGRRLAKHRTCWRESKNTTTTQDDNRTAR
eukprot:scaffold10399_cov94-Isochrysis_galbana.AAC.12